VQEVVDGFWKFEQTLTDESANGNDLTGEGGGPAYVDVGGDYWADFDGSDDAAAIAHGSQIGLDLTDECGFGWRMRPDEDAPVNDGVVGKTDGYGVPTDGWGAYMEQSGPPGTVQLIVFVVCDGTRYPVESGNLTSGTEYSVGVRLSVAGNFLKLYIDGSLADTSAIGSASPDPSDDEFSAGQFANTDFFLGRLNDLWLVGGECPTEQQVEDIHDNGFESVYGGLVAELTDEAAGTDAVSLFTGRTVNDSETVTDAFAGEIVGLHYSKSENQIALEAVHFAVAKGVADAGALGDATAFGRSATAEESQATSDSLTKAGFKRSFEETGGIVDELLGGGWARALTDAGTLADARSLLTALLKADSQESADDVDTLLVTGLTKAVEEQFAGDDATALAVGSLLAEAGTGADVLTLLAGAVWADSQGSADAGSRQPLPLWAEQFTASEARTVALTALRTESPAAADAAALAMALGGLAEGAELSESAALAVGLPSAEALSAADLAELLLSAGAGGAEEEALSEALVLSVRPWWAEELTGGDVLGLAVALQPGEEFAGVEAFAVAGEYHGLEAVAVSDAARPVLNRLLAGQVGTVEFENVTRRFWWEDVS